jgi:hypothetical protein
MHLNDSGLNDEHLAIQELTLESMMNNFGQLVRQSYSVGEKHNLQVQRSLKVVFQELQLKPYWGCL